MIIKILKILEDILKNKFLKQLLLNNKLKSQRKKLKKNKKLFENINKLINSLFLIITIFYVLM